MYVCINITRTRGGNITDTKSMQHRHRRQSANIGTKACTPSARPLARRHHQPTISILMVWGVWGGNNKLLYKKAYKRTSTRVVSALLGSAISGTCEYARIDRTSIRSSSMHSLPLLILYILPPGPSQPDTTLTRMSVCVCINKFIQSRSNSA